MKKVHERDGAVEGNSGVKQNRWTRVEDWAAAFGGIGIGKPAIWAGGGEAIHATPSFVKVCLSLDGRCIFTSAETMIVCVAVVHLAVYRIKTMIRRYSQ